MKKTLEDQNNRHVIFYWIDKMKKKHPIILKYYNDIYIIEAEKIVEIPAELFFKIVKHSQKYSENAPTENIFFKTEKLYIKLLHTPCRRP